MNDEEVIKRVSELRPPKRNAPPRYHPSRNPGSFSDGRGVYEVEEELVELYGQLERSRFRRLFQWQQWRLWYMWHKYWPTTVESVFKNRRAYLASLEL